MNMGPENYFQKQIKHAIPAIIKKYLDASKYKIFVFGSRASGKASARSDFDIGIEGPRAIPKATLAQIKAEIEELPTLYKIDVVDFTQVSSGFRKIAKQSIEIIS